jgi:hypothetical protein
MPWYTSLPARAQTYVSSVVNEESRIIDYAITATGKVPPAAKATANTETAMTNGAGAKKIVSGGYLGSVVMAVVGGLYIIS